MRHRVAGKKLGRSVGQRNALRRTLLTQFFEHERITTTRAKAEAIRAAAEEMITKAKRSLAKDDPQAAIAARRLLAGRLNGKHIVTKLFDDIAPRFASRPGGYTRLFRVGIRKGDAAEMVILELVERKKAGDEGTAAGSGTAQRGGLLSRFRRGGQPRAADQGEASAS